MLVAVPNVSEGRDRAVLERLEGSVGPARVLDVHVDPDHNRGVFTLAGRQGELAAGLVGLARAAVDNIDLRAHEGVHPHVGRRRRDAGRLARRGAARRGLRRGAHRGRAGRRGRRLPVFLYGELATRPEHAERAWLRRGGPPGSPSAWRPAS